MNDRRKNNGGVRQLNELFLDLLVEAVEQKDFASLRRMNIDSRIYTCLSSMAQQEKKWIAQRVALQSKGSVQPKQVIICSQSQMEGCTPRR